ncbi:TIGR01244 family sulfur transferase [Microbulbifer sp. SAOS-129_SWC]|uniref:TIGR01244 family sulfur transferase n=1 Tax=Microbulbifer sp. SAOS-129_SWC TaxID=3145235 RepID=UPI0032170E73
MNRKQLDEQVSVSEQFSCDQMALLADAGVEVVVCNRPEGETEDQPSHAEMRAAAAEHGLEFVAIPFPPGQMTAAHCREFAELLAQGKKLHAFCRTGNRACNVWAAARVQADADKQALLASARDAGFDISGVLVAFDPE